MRLPVRAIAALLMLSATRLQAQDSGQDDDSLFAGLVRAQYAAIIHGDSTTLGQQVANDLRWISATRGQVASRNELVASARALPAGLTLQFDVDSVMAQRRGDVASVEFRLSDRRTYRGHQNVFVSRASEVWAREQGRWRVLHHAQTWIIQPPATIVLDSVALAPFVGRYDRGDGYIDDVHFLEGHLVAQSTSEREKGEPGAHLYPVADAAFSPERAAPMIAFQRDASGKVTGYVQQQPDGTVARAPRMAGAAGH